MQRANDEAALAVDFRDLLNVSGDLAKVLRTKFDAKEIADKLPKALGIG